MRGIWTLVAIAGIVAPAVATARPEAPRDATPSTALRRAGAQGFVISMPRLGEYPLVPHAPAGHLKGAIPVPASAGGGGGAIELMSALEGGAPVSSRSAVGSGKRNSRLNAVHAKSDAGAGAMATSSSDDGEMVGAPLPRRTMVKDGDPMAGGSPRPTMLGEAEMASRSGSPSAARPEAPGAVAVAGVEGLVITLQWSDRSSNETGFVIEHQVRVGGTWSAGGSYTVGAGRESMQVTVNPGSHRFRVASIGDGGQSRWTSWSAAVDVNGVGQPTGTLPPAPQNLVVTLGPGVTGVTMRWDDMSANETGFEIERAPGFSDGSRTVGANTASTTDVVSPGTYSYRVRSYNGEGASQFTSWVQVVVTTDPPAAPTSLLARDQGNERDIYLQWVDESYNEEEFVLERQKQVGGVWGENTVLHVAADTNTLVDPAGLGTFRYRVASSNSIGRSTFGDWVSATASASGGWTEFTASPDTRIVYVSSSTGADTNDGLSPDRPKRTAAAGKAVIRDHYPDWLLFKRGDTWTDDPVGQWTKSGRSATEPILIGAYGDDPARPLFKTGTQGGFWTKYGPNESTELRYVSLVGLEFWAHTYTGTTNSNGIFWVMPGSDFLIEDCLVRGYNDNLSIQGQNNSAGSGLRNFSMRRCVVVDAYSAGSGHSQGIFMSKTTGALIEECVFDHNGWSETVPGAPPTAFNRNLYLSRSNSNVVTRGNISARSSSEGLQQRSGGLCEDNLFLNNSAGVLFGQWQSSWPDEATSGVIRNNVILDARDIDTNPRGHGIWVQRIDGVEISGNIVAHQRHGTGNIFAIYADYEYLNLTIRNNILHDWTGPDGSGSLIGLRTTPLGPMLVENNTLWQTNSGVLVSDAMGFAQFTYRGNRYHSNANASSWFKRLSSAKSYTQWVNESGETGSVASPPGWRDPDRTIETYMQSMQMTGTLDAFMQEARRQSRTSWRRPFTAAGVNEYIREGFSAP
jgi:hypothetical protein